MAQSTFMNKIITCRENHRVKKNSLFILLLSMLLIVLAACGDAETNEESADEGKKVLKAVTNAAYAPMEYMDKEKLVGLDIDLAKAVAEEAGYELEVLNVGWDPLFVEIESGRAQIGVSAISITEDRKEKYEFSVPYFVSTNKILVPEDSDITSAADLTDKTVAVLSGSTGMYAIEKVIGTNNKNIKKFETNVLAIQELKQNGADAVVADGAVIEEYVKNNPNDNFKVIDDSTNFEEEYYGYMYQKGNTELRDELNEAIEAIIDNGTYEEIYESWLGTKPNLSLLKEQMSL